MLFLCCQGTVLARVQLHVYHVALGPCQQPVPSL